jgi:DNA-binding transcriptional LysR family regulator
MELRHLRYFVVAAEELNVTRAAARLHLSQPPLSRQIRDLECELGVALFIRGANSLRLTDAGRSFLKEAKAILRRVDEAVAAVQAVAAGQAGEIHVGYAPSLTVGILPGALRHFQESNSGVRVQLHDLSTEEMLRGLREESLHAALMIRGSRAALPGLAFERVAEFPVAVVAATTHRLATKGKLGLKDLVDEKLIVYTEQGYPEYHAWLDCLFAKQKRRPSIAQEHDSSTALIAAVESGRGIALVQAGFELLSGARVAVRVLSPAPPPFELVCAFRNEAPLPSVRAFLEATRKAAAS